MAEATGPQLDPATVIRVASNVLSGAVDDVEWTVAPVSYTVLNPVSQGLYRVSGSAKIGGTTAPWTAVLKICRALTESDIARVPAERRTSFLDVQRWDREASAYSSGLLETLPSGLAAPRCLGVDRNDGTIWLWLEHVSEEMPEWDVQRYALAARHLGRLNGEYLAGREIPSYAWLSRDWIRGWSDYFRRTSPAILDDDRIWSHPLVVDVFAPSARSDLRSLLAMQDRWLERLDRLPLTLSHLDAFRANLMSRSTNGSTETVAIDWSFVGAAPLCADATQLLVGSLFYHGDHDRLSAEELTAACLDGYAEGLRDAGYHVDADALRRAHAINAVARWALIIGPLAAVEDPARQERAAYAMRRPFADVLGLIAERTRYLCALARSFE